MRELKFRVWDRDRKKYLHGYELNDIWTKTNTLEDDEIYFTIFSPYLKSVVIEQYTGVDDKNGTPIFEGDIISIKQDKDHEYFISRDNIVYLQIDFSVGAYLARASNGDVSALDVLACDEKDFTFPEVVGNIHENASLLEQYKCLKK